MQQAKTSGDKSSFPNRNESQEEESSPDEDEANRNEHSNNLINNQVNNNTNDGPQQTFNSDGQLDSSTRSSISPRRKKPPLNLDAALYLQSTATCVQQPNPNSRSRGATSAASSSTLVSYSRSATPTGTPLRLSSGSGGQQTPRGNNQSQQQQQQQQQFTFNCQQQANYQQTFDYYDANYSLLNNKGNISVDYIDCLSNNDLVAQRAQSATSDMRADRLCRKHLRFHRSRVDPSQHATAAPTSGDSSSNVTSSINGDDSLSNHDTSRVGLGSSNNNNSRVLYPISVSEVRKRTYFIGSLAQDSWLLGHEELYRYFPSGRVSIFVCTWNQNRKRSPTNLNELLLPEQLVNMPDIYAVGIQEAFSSQNDYLREWEVDLQTTLGPSHVLLHSCSLGVIHLALFVRRDLIWFCSTPEESVYNSRSMPTNMIKTKGAISIAFRFFGTSFMFTNCHFPPHENRLRDRIDEYQRIINSIDLPKNLKLLKPRYLSNDSTARFDCVFFMGDLNFRLEQRTFDETIHILEDIFQQKEPSYEALTQNDELLKVMETNQAFHGFDESQIKFPPTYKFLANTNKYDRQTKRVPSYTDRILFRSKRQRHIKCLVYDWLPQLVSSDHKPVYCLFDVLIRPGQEQSKMISTLNAGLFQRNVYLEALKRRAEDPDTMRGEDGASGSLICSIT